MEKNNRPRMILSAQTAYTILNYIASAGTIYDEIIDNVIFPNNHYKPELISELAIEFLEKPENIDKAIKGNYFNYYFMRIVKNMYINKYSQFFKNTRGSLMHNTEYNESTHEMEDDQSDIEFKILKENQNDALLKAIDEIKVNWFEAEIFKMYFQEGNTFRQIEEKTGVSYSQAWVVVNKIKCLIKSKIQEENII